MFYFFFKPKFHIKSFDEKDDNLSLEIYSKSKKCGFININTENIVYQYSLGLNGKKGLIDIANVVLSYSNNELLINLREGKNVISIECSKDIFDETFIYFNKIIKIKNNSEYKSKRDLFFNN
jgi:hypothetical protein